VRLAGIEPTTLGFGGQTFTTFLSSESCRYSRQIGTVCTQAFENVQFFRKPNGADTNQLKPTGRSILVESKTNRLLEKIVPLTIGLASIHLRRRSQACD